MVEGAPGVADCATTVPTRVPVVVGMKMTLTVQEAPEASVLPQLLVVE
jgi:hypothetical protein